MVLGACDAGKPTRPISVPLGETKASPLQRWPVGGELVRRSSGGFWIHGGGCRIHRLDTSSLRLDAIAPPPHCSNAAILDEGIAFKLNDGHWRVPASENRAELELDGGDVMVIRDYALHHVGHELTAITASSWRRWTLPVMTRIEARIQGGSRILDTAVTTRRVDNPDAPHPGEPYQYATTTIIDHEPASSSLRLRWIGLDGGTVDNEARLEIPAGARLAAFDWISVALVSADRVVQLYRNDFRTPTWSFRAAGDIVSVMLTPHFVFVDARLSSGLHEVHALSTQSGDPLWTRRVNAVRLQLFPYDMKIVLARDNVLAQIDRGTGEELWTWKLPEPPISVLRVEDDTWLASGASSTELFEITQPANTLRASRE